MLDDWNFLARRSCRTCTTCSTPARRAVEFPFDPRQCIQRRCRACRWAGGFSGLHVRSWCAGARRQCQPASIPIRADRAGAGDDFRALRRRGGAQRGHGHRPRPRSPSSPAMCALGASPEQALGRAPGDAGQRHVAAQPHSGQAGQRALASSVKPATAFSPGAPPDWAGPQPGDGRDATALQSTWNGRKGWHIVTPGRMTFHFGQLIAHIVKTRNVRRLHRRQRNGEATRTPGQGYSCIMPKRWCIGNHRARPTVHRVRAIQRHHSHRIRGAVSKACSAPLTNRSPRC